MQKKNALAWINTAEGGAMSEMKNKLQSDLEAQEPLTPTLPRYVPPRCECGVRFVADNLPHSEWCPVKHIYKRLTEDEK